MPLNSSQIKTIQSKLNDQLLASFGKRGIFLDNEESDGNLKSALEDIENAKIAKLFEENGSVGKADLIKIKREILEKSALLISLLTTKQIEQGGERRKNIKIIPDQELDTLLSVQIAQIFGADILIDKNNEIYQSLFQIIHKLHFNNKSYNIGSVTTSFDAVVSGAIDHKNVDQEAGEILQKHLQEQIKNQQIIIAHQLNLLDQISDQENYSNQKALEAAQNDLASYLRFDQNKVEVEFQEDLALLISKNETQKTLAELESKMTKSFSSMSDAKEILDLLLKRPLSKAEDLKLKEILKDGNKEVFSTIVDGGKISFTDFMFSINDRSVWEYLCAKGTGFIEKSLRDNFDKLSQRLDVIVQELLGADNVEDLVSLIEKDPTLANYVIKNAPYKGNSILHLAADIGSQEVIALLIAKKVDVNQKNSTGDTPLHRASACGHVDVVKFLVENGADINQKNSGGLTPLHRASASGHADVVKFLVENGADINQKNSAGLTPLRIAIKFGHKNVLEVLINKGVDIIKLYALKAANPEFDRNVEEDIRQEVRDYLRATKNFVNANDVETMKSAINEGANVNAMRSNGALYFAASRDLELTRLLIDKGVNINKYSSDQNPVFAASNVAIMRLLLASGCKIKPEEMSLGLYGLIINCKLDQLKILVDEVGVDDDVFNSGQNFLHDAIGAIWHGVEMVDVLLNKMSPALINRKADGERSKYGYNGKTAIEFALQEMSSENRRSINIFKALLNHPKVEIGEKIIGHIKKTLNSKNSNLNLEHKAEILQLMQKKIADQKAAETEEEDVPSEKTSIREKISKFLPKKRFGAKK